MRLKFRDDHITIKITYEDLFKFFGIKSITLGPGVSEEHSMYRKKDAKKNTDYISGIGSEINDLMKDEKEPDTGDQKRDEAINSLKIAVARRYGFKTYQDYDIAKQIMVMHDDGVTFKEIGKKMGMSASMAQSRYHKLKGDKKDERAET